MQIQYSCARDVKLFLVLFALIRKWKFHFVSLSSFLAQNSVKGLVEFHFAKENNQICRMIWSVSSG